MTDTFALNSQPELNSLFDAIGVGVVLIDQQFRVKSSNSKAEKILNYAPASGQEAFCFTLFCEGESVCADCPLHSPEVETVQTKSYRLQKNHADIVLIKVNYQKWQDLTVMTIFDVTKEVSILKKIDLSRKEAEARNILLDRRLHKSHDEMADLKSLIDHLPEALVSVDESYTIKRRNATVKKIFTVPEAEKCYELLGHDFPCEHCPAEKGIEFAHDFKKSHAVGDAYYTELFVTTPSEKGGILLFTETTRQIRLIEEIRTQQNTLTGLVELSAKMQKETDARLVLEFFLDTFLTELVIDSAALLVDEIRTGNVWLNLQRGLAPETMDNITKSYLSREVQSSLQTKLPATVLPWTTATQIPLIGGQGKKVGLIALPGNFSAEIKKKISLYTESVGAYVHNRLLMKLLEEKANTDQLTGLYNRRFFEQVLVEEQEKFKKYHINFALVVADINKLKYVNDKFGHVAGDQLISTVANMLNISIRKTDVLARMGGDEFFMLLTDSSDSDAQQFINRLQQKVFKDVTIAVGEGEHFPVTISLGAAGSDCFTFEELSKAADGRMYANKEEFYQTREKYR